MADSRVHAAASSARDSLRGATPSTASAIARMWSGVVPQQPPTKLSRPDSANSFSVADISSGVSSYSAKALGRPALGWALTWPSAIRDSVRSEEHTSELQSLMRISYAVFCLKKKKIIIQHTDRHQH